MSSQQLPPAERLLYSPAEFAAHCGRSPTWAYRLCYAGKIRAVSDFGRLMIPRAELLRIVDSAAIYDPQVIKSPMWRKCNAQKKKRSAADDT